MFLDDFVEINDYKDFHRMVKMMLVSFAYLRLLIACFMLVGSAMIGSATFNFNTCRTTIIFGTVKGNNLKIVSLPIKYGCSYKKGKMASALCLNGF